MQESLLGNPLVPMIAIVKNAARVEQFLVVCQTGSREGPSHEHIPLLNLLEFLACEAALYAILSRMDYRVDGRHDAFIGIGLEHVTDGKRHSEVFKRLAFVQVPHKPDNLMISLTKCLDDSLPDKTCCSCNKDFHRCTLILC